MTLTTRTGAEAGTGAGGRVGVTGGRTGAVGQRAALARASGGILAYAHDVRLPHDLPRRVEENVPHAPPLFCPDKHVMYRSAELVGQGAGWPVSRVRVGLAKVFGESGHGVCHRRMICLPLQMVSPVAVLEFFGELW